MTKAYAGIGSQKTPMHIQTLMVDIAIMMRQQGFILRSGGAFGADKAFALGAGEECEIWLPRVNHDWFKIDPIAYQIARRHHPAWDKCSSVAKALHARNSHIILGRDLETPVQRVICWTIDGEATGGTGQGIRIAQAYNIPIDNLFHPHVRYRYEQEVLKWRVHKSA